MKRSFAVVTVIIITGAGLLAWDRFLPDDQPVRIPKSPQRSGNAAKGFDYLVNGDYVSGGIPYDFFIVAQGKNAKNELERKGLAAQLPHDYNLITARNGEKLVAPNCLQCHAQVFDGKLVVGMGNTFVDFTKARVNPQSFLMMENMLKRSPSKYEAVKPFLQVSKTIAPLIGTAVRGVNSADRLAAVLVSHRDPQTLIWSDSALLDIPEGTIPSDTPPWWLLKKKNAMFYNGFGRGDFGRFLMASNLLTVSDSAEASKVDEYFNDVLAYIYSLQPPKYPAKIDEPLAKQGELIFLRTCSKCHGKYGANPSYPNLLIPESIIETDSLLYKSNYQNPQFVKWFNSSWFAQGDHPARLEPYNGYIAPPLDGIWATAPYLHNGSVPNIETLLENKSRPRYWQRNFAQPEYDLVKLGWKYEKRAAPGSTEVYNTDLPGYGNDGHYFGDRLTAQQRKAVIEYLKTL